MAAWVESLWPNPLFCGFESDCSSVTQSAYASLAGLSLGFLGVVAFGLFLALSLFSLGQRLLPPLAIVAGLMGCVLLFIQLVVLGQVCQLCLVADLAGLVLGFLVVAWPLQYTGRVGPWQRGFWLGWLMILGLAPWAWAFLHPGLGLPDEVRALWQPDRMTIVLVTDFECEACRQTHPVLADFLRGKVDNVTVVQKIMPLPKHPRAKSAARAYFCAGEQGQAQKMSNELFHHDDLSETGIEKAVEKVGLDKADFKTCFLRPGLDAQIEADTAWVRKTGAKGLPVIWIQDQPLQGVQTTETLERAWKRAQQRWKQ